MRSVLDAGHVQSLFEIRRRLGLQLEHIVRCARHYMQRVTIFGYDVGFSTFMLQLVFKEIIGYETDDV